ncbi:MAG: biotin transporter BioY [Thermotogae bacterium]|nr:biotin transporter BioY [Thermotogota bacterium]
MKARRLVRIALFCAITAVMAQLRVDIGPVPITFQVLAVMLTGLFLRPGEAFLSQLVYVLMGLIGLPVYAGFRSGAGMLLGPTGGYLVAFPIAAFLIAYLQPTKKGSVWKVFSALAGLLPIYLIGWLVLSSYVGEIGKAFQIGVLPFIWIDIIKAVVAGIIMERIKKYVSGFTELTYEEADR